MMFLKLRHYFVLNECTYVASLSNVMYRKFFFDVLKIIFEIKTLLIVLNETTYVAWRTFQRRSHGPELQGDKLLGTRFNFDIVGEIFIKSIDNIFVIYRTTRQAITTDFFDTCKILGFGLLYNGCAPKDNPCRSY